MITDTYELVDRSLDLVSGVKFPRRIRTKKNSFASIKKIWSNFRQNRNAKKLEKLKEKALTTKFKMNSNSELTDKSLHKIDKLTGPIARLEAKLSIIETDLGSKEELKEVVNKRAIRLRENMISNLRYNSGNAYSVGLDKKEAVFSLDEPVDNNVEEKENNELEQAMTSESIDNSKNVVDKIVEEEKEKIAENAKKIVLEEENNELEQAMVSESIDNSKNVVDKIVEEENAKIAENVKKIVLEEENTETEKQEKQVREDIIVVPTDLERNAIKEVIDENFDKQQELVENEDTTIEENLGKDELEKVISEAFKTISEDDKTVIESEEESEMDEESTFGALAEDEIKAEIDAALDRVSMFGNDTKAKIDMFDENGERKLNPNEEDNINNDVKSERYNYTPMTDEEIIKARENIEYDKYEKEYLKNKENNKNIDNKEDTMLSTFVMPKITFSDIFKPAENVDDVVNSIPLTATEITENEDLKNTYNDDNDLHFDYSEVTAKEVNDLVSSVTNIKDLEALKKRSAELKKRQEATNKAREEAEKEAKEMAQRALDEKRKVEELKKAYDLKIEKLRLYNQALEEDCIFNENKSSLAKSAAENNKKIIEAQQSEADEIDALIGEIDSIISPEAINVNYGSEKRR